jgi:hypothetical protein
MLNAAEEVLKEDHMKKPRNIARYASSLILATTVGLLSFGASVLESFALAGPPDAPPSWSSTGSLNANRSRHTATLLPNGKVLAVGGGDPVNGSAELYHPSTGRWSYTGSLIQRRTGHSATLLQNGQVLVAGGVNYGLDVGFRNLDSAELYDPATGEWRPTGSFNRIGGYNSATLLSNGKVLAYGGGPPGANAELYDPATGTWSSTSSPSSQGLMISLPNGKALITDGNSAELYDPATETWTSPSTGSPNVLHRLNTATILNNGKILVTGPDLSGNVFIAELYDMATGTWSRTGDLKTVGDEGKTATLLPSGMVLIAGGATCSDVKCTSGNRSELYDPTTGTWSLTSELNRGRAYHAAVLLPNGKVLFAGGYDADYLNDGDTFYAEYLSSAELYDQGTTPTPGGNHPPVINSLTGGLSGDTLTLTIAATDTDGDLAQAQVSLLNESNSVVTELQPIALGNDPSPARTVTLNINGMAQFPSALKTSVALLDSRSNRSGASTFDFSRADSGGPDLRSSSFDGVGSMTIKGGPFAGALQLEINGVVVAPVPGIKIKGRGAKLKIGGSQSDLNLRSGANRVRLLSDGLRSNIFVLTI